MSEERQLLETVKFGIEVESFLDGRLGRYLIDRARHEAEEAIKGLKHVDPVDYQQIVKLQNSVYRAESIESWLAEAVQEGWNAEAQLRATEES